MTGIKSWIDTGLRFAILASLLWAGWNIERTNEKISADVDNIEYMLADFCRSTRQCREDPLF